MPYEAALRVWGRTAESSLLPVAQPANEETQ